MANAPLNKICTPFIPEYRVKSDSVVRRSSSAPQVATDSIGPLEGATKRNKLAVALHLHLHYVAPAATRIQVCQLVQRLDVVKVLGSARETAAPSDEQ